MSTSSTPTVSVSVSVTEEDGHYSAVYAPALPEITGVTVIAYSLDTEGWSFGPVTFDVPFSNLETVSPAQFNITFDGGASGTYSFQVVLVQDGAHRGAPSVQLETDPEVLNGPH